MKPRHPHPRPPLTEGGPRRPGEHGNLCKYRLKQGVVSNLDRHLFPPLRLGKSGSRRRRGMTCFPGNQVDCIPPIWFSFNRVFEKRTMEPGFHLLLQRGKSELAIGRHGFRLHCRLRKSGRNENCGAACSLCSIWSALLARSST